MEILIFENSTAGLCFSAPFMDRGRDNDWKRNGIDNAADKEAENAQDITHTISNKIYCSLICGTLFLEVVSNFYLVCCV